MKSLLPKTRGVVATGLLWVPARVAMFAVLIAIVSMFVPIRSDAGPNGMAAIIGWVGFVSGALFGVVLSFAEGGKPVRDLSSAGAAFWGLLGSAVFPLVTGRGIRTAKSDLRHRE